MAFRLKASDTLPAGSIITIHKRVADSPTDEVGKAVMGARWVDLNLDAGPYLACNEAGRSVAFTVQPSEEPPLVVRVPKHQHVLEDVDGVATLAPLKHRHSIADIDGLQAVLDSLKPLKSQKP